MPDLGAVRHTLQADPGFAVSQLRDILRHQPDDADAWRLLGKAFRALGSDAEAEAAELCAIDASAKDPELLSAATALFENDLPRAEPQLRRRLKENPEDVAAIRMMAELAGRLGRNEDAEKLLRRALELAPAFAPARANLATALYRQNRAAEAVAQLDLLIAQDAANPALQNLKAAALGRLGSYEEANLLYERILVARPDEPKLWMSYGHSLKTVGRLDDCIAAYRRALSLAPSLGEIWWSLANLKTVRFTDDDVASMEAVLGSGNLTPSDRIHLHFALGRAHEERAQYAQSFGHYDQGNKLRHEQSSYDPAEITRIVERSRALFTPDFFAARQDFGSDAPDPIFIVGMPRAGSTLIEQILSSHPKVEGTMELPDIPAIAKRLGARRAEPGDAPFPLNLAALQQSESKALGDEYLERTRVQRKSDRPYFIDKLPNNWINIGLIRLILPNAKIIDARRHPLDCCFSNFKQHYARGQGFSYSLEDMGRYYAEYVGLMAHFDGVLPTYIHRVQHEELIEDPEGEIRRLLAFLGLDFDPGCLVFHENKRAVRTASSEQVRRPINRDGVDQWRNFDFWLDPLRKALGDVVDGNDRA